MNLIDRDYPPRVNVRKWALADVGTYAAANVRLSWLTDDETVRIEPFYGSSTDGLAFRLGV
jgi:hypothetical protein